MSQSFMHPTTTRTMAMVLWRRSPGGDVSTLGDDALVTAIDASVLDSVQKLLGACIMKLGNPDLEPVRMVIDSVSALNNCTQLITRAHKTVKCKVPGATFLRKQSRHGRYILDEMEETIVKCAHSHSVRADALITFVDSAGDIDIFYEIAITEKRVLEMFKCTISNLKKTTGDNADFICWRINYDIASPSSRGVNAVGKLTLTTSDAVEYTSLMQLLMDNIQDRRPRPSSFDSPPVTVDGAISSGSRRTWAQAFEEEESDSVIIVKRRENTGGRKKKRESVDSDADAEQEDAAIVMPAQSPSSDSESSLSLDSGVHPSEAPMPLDDVPPPPGEHQLTSASLSLLRLVASGTPMILWIDAHVGVQRNIMPDALLTQMLEGEKGCDICCIFPAPRCLAELYNWVFEVQRRHGKIVVSHSVATYAVDAVLSDNGDEAERNECVSLLAICSADSGHAASRMCRALDKTHYSCLSDFAAALQRKRSDIVVDDDQPIDVMHVIVAPQSIDEAATAQSSSAMTEKILEDVVGASDSLNDKIEVVVVTPTDALVE